MTDQSAQILIVDDQLSGREVLRGLLSGQGYSLSFASDGQEALALAGSLFPDLILLDVMMPQISGFDVCRQLRADPNLAEIPVIMVTALDDHNSRLEGFRAGADDFISKPFDPLELRARVQTVTRLNRYRRLLTERYYRQEAEAEVDRRNRDLTLLNHVVIAAASSLKVTEILYTACEALAQALDLPQATALLLDQSRRHFSTEVDYLAPHLQLEQRLAGGLAQEHIPLAALLPSHPPDFTTAIILGDGQVADPWRSQAVDFMKEQGYSSALLVPILIDDQLGGILELKSSEPYPFSPQDCMLAQSIAAALGQAIQKVLLYQSLQEHANNLEQTVAKRTRELQQERDRTQAILQALGEAVVVTDMTGTIQYLNPAAAALTGYRETEALGQNWQLWQSVKSRDQAEVGAEEPIYPEIQQAIEREAGWHGEVNNKRKDGTLYDVLLTVAPLYDPEQPDQLAGCVSVQSNITPLKEAERIRTLHQEREKQAALDRLRHTFLSTVNHEMRTPLVLIFQGIEMLEESKLGKLTAEQLDMVATIRRQAQTLGQMVEGLTQVAAFLSKQETVKPRLAQLNPVLENVVLLAEFKARSKGITLETEITPDLPTLHLDAKQLEEALNQLVDNAIKFNQAGGAIKISVAPDHQGVKIAVSDTGTGIEAEDINRIWEIFEQGIDPIRRAQEGLGLGLVLARYIVEAHRGTIRVETKRGKGSTFTVRLPKRRATTGRLGK